MFNVGGISTENYVNIDQILANTNFIAISAIVDNTAKGDDGKCLAGTPLNGDFTKRDGGANAFTKATAGTAAEGTTPETPSNANCVLLHDIEFDGSNDANATVLIKGTVQLKHMDSDVEELYTALVIKALAAHGIDCINPTPAS